MNARLTVYTGGDILIRYGFHSTPFGEALIALSDQGICGLWFLGTESREEAVARRSKEWPTALLRADPQGTSSMMERVFQGPDEPGLKVHVRGTGFQIRVWEALLSLDPGEVTTYEAIARTVGERSAVRAVGSAIGRNRVAFVIPCHRVIRTSGELGGYRWGVDRKRAILDWESLSNAEKRLRWAGRDARAFQRNGGRLQPELAHDP